MKQIFINQYEKPASDDINQMQLAAAQSMQDDVLYRFFGQPSAAVFGSDLTVSYVGALASSIAAGVGFFYDSAQTGNSPKLRMIKAAAAIPVTHTAADPTNPRIDRICLAPNFAVTGTASRYIKSGGTGPITLSTVSKTKEMTYTLQVVAGTPAGSPSAPATPAGYISLATVTVSASTGISGSGAYVDTRTILGLTVSNTGHNILTHSTIQTQFDDADTWMSKMLFVTSGLSGIAPGTTLLAATHAGRMLQWDISAAQVQATLTLPAASANGGLRCWLNDLTGNFGNGGLQLVPNGTDKIMGSNSSYNLEANWGTWMLWCDATNGWFIK